MHLLTRPPFQCHRHAAVHPHTLRLATDTSPGPSCFPTDARADAQDYPGWHYWIIGQSLAAAQTHLRQDAPCKTSSGSGYSQTQHRLTLPSVSPRSPASRATYEMRLPVGCTDALSLTPGAPPPLLRHPLERGVTPSRYPRGTVLSTSRQYHPFRVTPRQFAG